MELFKFIIAFTCVLTAHRLTKSGIYMGRSMYKIIYKSALLFSNKFYAGVVEVGEGAIVLGFTVLEFKIYKHSGNKEPLGISKFQVTM